MHSRVLFGQRDRERESESGSSWWRGGYPQDDYARIRTSQRADDADAQKLCNVSRRWFRQGVQMVTRRFRIGAKDGSSWTRKGKRKRECELVKFDKIG